MIAAVLESAAGTLIGILAWNLGQSIRAVAAPAIGRWLLRKARGQ